MKKQFFIFFFILFISSIFVTASEFYFVPVSSGLDWVRFEIIPGSLQSPSIYYNATQAAIIRGTIDGGSLEDTQHPNGNYDSVTFNFSEVSGSPGLDLRINFTNITDFNQGIIRYKTSSLSGDSPIIQLWNYPYSKWEDYPHLIETSSFFIIFQPVFDYSEHLQEGIVQMRLYKNTNGNTNNHYFVDWITISSGDGTPSSTPDLTDYAKYEFGNNNFNGSGNFTTIGNGNFNKIVINGNSDIYNFNGSSNIIFSYDMGIYKCYNKITKTGIWTINKSDYDWMNCAR